MVHGLIRYVREEFTGNILFELSIKRIIGKGFEDIKISRNENELPKLPQL
jgi:hypothetical protein